MRRRNIQDRHYRARNRERFNVPRDDARFLSRIQSCGHFHVRGSLAKIAPTRLFLIFISIFLRASLNRLAREERRVF